MKTINIYLEDSEHEELNRLKGNMSWKEFFTKNSKCVNTKEYNNGKNDTAITDIKENQ